jgi:hypothetical protein
VLFLCVTAIIYLSNPSDSERNALSGLHVLAHGVQGHHL